MNELTSKSGEHHQRLLTAFKYILDFYYGDVSYETISNVLGSKQVSLDDLHSSAKDFGLECEAIELERDIIEAHLVPCIAMGHDGRVGIVKALENGFVTLQDMAYEVEESVDMVSFQKHFHTLLAFHKPTDHSAIL